VNPFGNQSSTHSTWPVVLSLYNLPPWLCKKHKYMMLTILVSGPMQPGDCIDVYFRPLVDDFKILWKPGVLGFGMSTSVRSSQCMACCLPPSTTTWLSVTSLARVKERCSLPTLLGRYLRNMAKTFKEIRIYGASSFPRQETSISSHGLSV
jgi:hypothetical protein